MDNADADPRLAWAVLLRSRADMGFGMALGWDQQTPATDKIKWLASLSSARLGPCYRFRRRRRLTWYRSRPCILTSKCLCRHPCRDDATFCVFRGNTETVHSAL